MVLGEKYEAVCSKSSVTYLAYLAFHYGGFMSVLMIVCGECF